MAERLVWIKDATIDPMLLDCGHDTRGNGHPTPSTSKPPRSGDEWYCGLCALHVNARLDQELELVKDTLADSSRRARELDLGPSGAPRIRLPESTGKWWDKLWGNISGREYDRFWSEVMELEHGEWDLKQSKIDHDLDRMI